MTIGQNIKRLRRNADMTQEELAEMLSISSQAVSRWETDSAMPDISLLPALCHIFDVSSDVLLGIDIEKNNEAIQNYLDKAREQEYDGNFENSVDILREAIRKFPKSYEVMQNLANDIVSVNCRKGIKEYDEAFELCNRILAECTDSVIRYEAIRTLGVAYGYADKKDEMLKLAEEMPKAHFSYENFMLYRWNGDADFSKRQSYISYLINQLLSSIGCACGHRHDDGQMFYSSDERIELYKLQVSLLEVLFPDGDYQYAAQYIEIACSRIVVILMRNKDFEGAWHWIEKGVDFAIHFDTYSFDSPHTSLILRGYSDGGWIMEKSGNRSQTILEWLTTDNETAVFRSDARFEPLVNRLKAVAKKP